MISSSGPQCPSHGKIVLKCYFYLLELDFLGHHILHCGIEANTLKVDKILHWPIPHNPTNVCSFLSLVWYISVFLPKLADFTCILTPLTTKESCCNFPTWNAEHQATFDAIKSLIISRECLTTIDHTNLGDNKVFVTCDASDWRTGVTLSVGTSWELAHPVAFNSMQLKGPEKDYLVHEKKLLSIICTLKKWCSHCCLYWSSHTPKFQYPTWSVPSPTLLARIHVTIWHDHHIYSWWR